MAKAKRLSRPSQHDMTTQVGKCIVPIRDIASAKVLRFTDGLYVFWTAVLKRRYFAGYNGGQKVWRTYYGGVRAGVGWSAGDRFDRMEYERRASYIPKTHRPIYDKIWREILGEGKNIKFIRPATSAEIRAWLGTHPSDTDHLEF